jgi:molybdate transport system ATP-binding protein
VAVFRPAAVILHRVLPEGSARNVVQGQVEALIPEGDRVRVRLDSRPPLVAEITSEAAAALGIHEGGRVWATFKATEVEVFSD